MKEKELKSNEIFKNKTASKNRSNLISKHQLLISDHKAITLIALIITIIVMLILVGVTVTIALNGGLFSQAKKAVKAQIEAGEREQIGLALVEWKIRKEQPNPPTFEEFLKERFGDDNVTAGGVENEYIVTFPETGNQYNVKDDGTITSNKGISVNPNNLTLILKEGTDVTQEISATLNGIKGEIKWTNSEESIASISSDTGDTITVKAIKKGETTITASCGSYSAQCTVKVIESIPIGSYIRYNVTYTDMYSDIEYTAENGWRYLGIDDNGNQLIVSTGIPLMLTYAGYDFEPNFSKWRGTDEQIEKWYSPDFVGKVYDCPGIFAACGLMYNFEKLPYCNINDYPSWYSDDLRTDSVCGTVKDAGYLMPLGQVFRAPERLDQIEGVRSINVDDIENACQACGVDRRWQI